MGLSTIFSYVLDGYNAYISPVVDRIADGISDVLIHTLSRLLAVSLDLLEELLMH